jgi:hypothetical protein
VSGRGDDRQPEHRVSIAERGVNDRGAWMAGMSASPA